jgi:hypothetical protein
MTQEQAEIKLNEEKPLLYFLRGLKVVDGDFTLDACVAFNRNDAREEAKKFLKFTLYDLTKSKNQNL